MSLGEYYKEDESVMQIVNLGRELITKCEQNKIFGGNTDEEYKMWNDAVTVGNKLTTFGTTWGLQSTSQLSEDERKVLKAYLDIKKNS